MRTWPTLRGDVPTTPPLLQRSAMVGRGVPQPRNRGAVCGGRDAAREKAGNPRGGRRQVARQASCIPNELRDRCRRLLEHVEHRAEPGIVGRDLDESARHPRDRGRVVEENDPRIRRIDPGTLEARLRIHRQLRFDRDVERRQQRLQVASLCLELQRLAARLQPVVQLLDRTRRRRFRVSDGRMVDVDGVELAGRHSGGPAGQLERKQRNEHGTLHLCCGERRLSTNAEGSDMLTTSHRDFLRMRRNSNG